MATGKHNAYFVMNHILKLRGGNILSARAAMVGIFLQNSKFEQSEMLITVYPNLLAKFIEQNRTKFQ